tara:strand:+ start:1367 stop:1513 length:147 start_codon:yes stop_codon:yes gene_type:complete
MKGILKVRISKVFNLLSSMKIKPIKATIKNINKVFTSLKSNSFILREL